MMSQPKEIFIGVVGLGGVGTQFISQLSTLQSRLSSRPSHPVTLTLVLLARSSKVLFSESYRALTIDLSSPSSWQDALSSSSQPPFSTTRLVEYLSNTPGRCILVDNTSSEDLSSSYPLFLKKGISIVTPNKKGFSGTYAAWTDIFSSAGSHGGYVFHEATVGAGLPVISTLKDLIETGDEVEKIEGVFSGTMSFLFNNFMSTDESDDSEAGMKKFSDEVKKAKELGYTEPDPRDDLNGLDVARKLTILARLAGLEVESPTSFEVESLIPKELESCKSGDEFLSRLPEFDGAMDKRKKDAEDSGRVLRYVGTIDMKKKELKVGIEALSRSHPVAGLKGSDNIINFYTKRYGDKPLIIQGAGAGGAVTAMGVTADLIKAINLLK